MLFYMQMKNWFLIFLILVMAYLIQQKSSATNKLSYRASAPLLSVIRQAIVGMAIIRKQYFWMKTHFLDMKFTWKNSGLEGLYKKYGFKFFAAFFIYYIVRDSFIYLILPWFVANKIAHQLASIKKNFKDSKKPLSSGN